MRLGAPGGTPGAPTGARDLHLAMLEAVLSGDGLGRVAQLASRAGAGSVAIVVPRLGIAAGAPADDERVAALHAHLSDGGPAPVLAAQAPIRSGDEVLGVVASFDADAPEVLAVAALVALTEVAIAEARDEVAENLRGSFLEDLRSGAPLDRAEVLRRGARLGCDLSQGAVAICAELETARPRQLAAMVSEDAPGALAQHVEGSDPPRLLALLPAAAGDGDVLERARRVSARLARHGVVGASSLQPDPEQLGRALDEAELVLDVTRRSGRPVGAGIGSGTYRLLFRVLASHPEEVAGLFEETVAPIVRHDDQYRTDLVGTLDAYLSHDCNMNATAAAIYAHRHTVAHRLERVKELTGLDPARSEDRERLGLGLKAHRLVADRLPR